MGMKVPATLMHTHAVNVWAASITVEPTADGRGDLYLFQAIHQEADVVPESVDAVRAITGAADGPESVRRTNEALGIGRGLAGLAPGANAPVGDAASDD